MSFFDKKQIEKILQLTIDAGEIAKEFFKSQDFEVKRKNDNSKVTSADIAISRFLDEKLTKEFTQIPIICEEGDHNKKIEDIFWLIDPIDGTNSFIDGKDQFALNIALVKNRKPIFGLIYAPLYQGGRAVFTDFEDEISILDSKYNLSKLNLKKETDNQMKIVTSTRTKDENLRLYFKNTDVNKLQINRISSAIKFIDLLEQNSNLYLHFRPSMEWDTAAGQAMVELAGGSVKSLSFNDKKDILEGDFTYKKPNFFNQPFVAKLNY